MPVEFRLAPLEVCVTISNSGGIGISCPMLKPKISPKSVPKTEADIPAVVKIVPHCFRFRSDLLLSRRPKAVTTSPCPRSPNIIPKKTGKTSEIMGVGSTSCLPGNPWLSVTFANALVDLE